MLLERGKKFRLRWFKRGRAYVKKKTRMLRKKLNSRSARRESADNSLGGKEERFYYLAARTGGLVFRNFQGVA